MATRRTLALNFGVTTGLTALLVGFASLIPSAAGAQEACYPPRPPGEDCSGNDLPGNKPSTPPGNPPTEPPRTPPATPPGCNRAAEVRADRDVMLYGTTTNITVAGAPGSTVDLLFSDPAGSAPKVVRTTTLDSNGIGAFTPAVSPQRNSTYSAQQRGCAAGQGGTINVRSKHSAITAVRDKGATRTGGLSTYSFSGTVLPGTAGRTVTMYVVSDDGSEVRKAVATTGADGRWSMSNVRFVTRGTFTLLVRTGNDVLNVAGVSPQRPTAIF